MKPHQIIQIVPQLPPAINGLGDYALNLARQLRKDYGIETRFIVGDIVWKGAAEIEGFPVSQVSYRSPDALLTLLSSDRSYPILLHYVGYGYAQRGCPVWLVDGLQRWKSLFPKRSLVTMFHEIYASGPPWTSSFWLSTVQRTLAARLAKLSDRCITSKQLYADIITDISRGKHYPVPCLPVFSNIGEPDKVPSNLSERQRRLVVFGGIANRAKVYQDCQSTLEYVCQRLNILEIWDVGTLTRLTPSLVGKIPIIETGEQPAKKVSEILADSVAGFANYNPDYIAKSGIFAAYCAHRLLPINVKVSKLIVDGIKPGIHYWVPMSKGNKLDQELDIQVIANNAYSWYQDHNLLSHTNIFASQLLNLDKN